MDSQEDLDDGITLDARRKATLRLLETTENITNPTKLIAKGKL